MGPSQLERAAPAEVATWTVSYWRVSDIRRSASSERFRLLWPVVPRSRGSLPSAAPLAAFACFLYSSVQLKLANG